MRTLLETRIIETVEQMNSQWMKQTEQSEQKMVSTWSRKLGDVEERVLNKVSFRGTTSSNMAVAVEHDHNGMLQLESESNDRPV